MPAPTARTFGLEPGSEVSIGVPSGLNVGLINKVSLDVTGIVAATDPGSTFWKTDPLLPAPPLEYNFGTYDWVGAVFADPGELAAVQDVFGADGLRGVV